jgi:hypothetical protein
MSQVAKSFITPSLSSLVFQTKQERRCFDFFCRRTILQLSSAFNLLFWDRLLVPATHHELAIRHAAIALGALHEHFEQRSNQMEDEDVFALQRYVKAIELLTAPVRDRGKPAADVALMTCVLFVCFEVNIYPVSC